MLLNYVYMVSHIVHATFTGPFRLAMLKFLRTAWPVSACAQPTSRREQAKYHRYPLQAGRHRKGAKDEE